MRTSLCCRCARTLTTARLTAERHTPTTSPKPCPQSTQASDIHASIKEKNGKRAAFYDISMVLNFRGVYAASKGRATGEMAGVFRMYNIGQDTRFCPGGDKETSYMYELGLAAQYHGTCEPWATQIKENAAELFEEVSLLITQKFVPAVEAKGELVK